MSSRLDAQEEGFMEVEFEIDPVKGYLFKVDGETVDLKNIGALEMSAMFLSLFEEKERGAACAIVNQWYDAKKNENK